MGKVISLHFLKKTFTLEAVYQYGKTEILIICAKKHYCKNQCKDIDVDVWILAMSTLAKRPPPMFGEDFYQRCHSLILHQFSIDLFCDITISNCVGVFEFLRNNV